jgi:hypothetical protein
MREPLEQLDLAHHIPHFVLLQALQSDSLDGHHLARAEVERAVYRPKLPSADTVAELLFNRSARVDS